MDLHQPFVYFYVRPILINIQMKIMIITFTIPKLSIQANCKYVPYILLLINYSYANFIPTNYSFNLLINRQILGRGSV